MREDHEIQGGVTLLGGGFCLANIDWDQVAPGEVIKTIDMPPSIFTRSTIKIDWIEARYNEDF
jgi:hypothetical protein